MVCQLIIFIISLTLIFSNCAKIDANYQQHVVLIHSEEPIFKSVLSTLLQTLRASEKPSENVLKQPDIFPRKIAQIFDGIRILKVTKPGFSPWGKKKRSSFAPKTAKNVLKSLQDATQVYKTAKPGFSPWGKRSSSFGPKFSEMKPKHRANLHKTAKPGFSPLYKRSSFAPKFAEIKLQNLVNLYKTTKPGFSPWGKRSAKNMPKSLLNPSKVYKTAKPGFSPWGRRKRPFSNPI